MVPKSEPGSFKALLDVLPCEVTEIVRALVERPNEAVVLSGLDAELLYKNAAYYRSLGFEPGEPMDAEGIHRVHADDQEAARLSVERTLAQGHSTIEYRVRHRNGEWQWRFASNVLLRDRDGRPAALLFIIRDITRQKRVEESLQQSEERLRHLVESAEDVILLVNSSRRVVWARVPRGYGVGSETLVGRQVTDVFPPEVARQLREDGDDVFRTGESRGFERCVPLAGRWVWFHNVVYPVRDEAGHITHIGWICRNITERKEAEAALVKERETSRRYLDIAGVIIGTLDTAGRIMQINQRGAEVLGRPAAELIGRNLFDELIPERYREPMRDGFLRVMGGENLPFEEYELPIINARGEERIVWWHSTLLRDEGGNIIGALSSGEDVTDRHRAEEALKHSEERYRGVVEDQTELIGRFSSDGTITFVNAAISRACGVAPEKMLGMKMSDLLDEADRERLEQCMASLSCDCPVSEMETRMRLPSGDVGWQQWVIRAICDVSGRIVEYQGVGRDVTEIKHAHAMLIEKSRMETASMMAGGIAHDFNNLMVAVLGNAELLRSEVNGDSDALDMLDAVTRSARRASELAQKLLAFARGGKYRAQAVNLNDVVTESVQIQSRTLPSGVRVVLDLDPEVTQIEADRVQMGQVVMNLLINAVEAIGQEGTISISTKNGVIPPQTSKRSEVAPGPCVYLRVADTGRGMDPMTVARIFEPFFSSKGPGRGLGLPATFGIVKNHGGDITVQSVVDRGTTFTVCMPAKQRAEPVRPSAGTRMATGTETILVIDDEVSVLDVTRRMLVRLGYTVLTAPGGAEGVRIANEHRGEIDLALLDLGMPGMDGAEVFPLLRAARPEMKIIISSGYDREAMSRGMLKTDAAGFVQKPFISEDLAREIRRALDSE